MLLQNEGYAMDHDISMNIQPLSSAESAISPTALGLQTSSNVSPYPNKQEPSSMRFQQSTQGASMYREMIRSESTGRASSGRNGRGRRKVRQDENQSPDNRGKSAGRSQVSKSSCSGSPLRPIVNEQINPNHYEREPSLLMHNILQFQRTAGTTASIQEQSQAFAGQATKDSMLHHDQHPVSAQKIAHESNQENERLYRAPRSHPTGYSQSAAYSGDGQQYQQTKGEGVH